MIEVPGPGPLLIDVGGTALTAEDRELLVHPAVGGVILFTRNYVDRQQLIALTTAMRKLRPNLLIVADTEGGRVQRFRAGFTPIPAMARLAAWARRDRAAAWAAAREIAWLLAAELAGVGVDLPLAPVVDIDYGASGAIGDRAFAGEPETVTALAGAFAEGLVAAGSAVTAKHFPGHGFVAADSHAELPVDERDREALAPDMAPYRALIAGGLASVMMAHVRYPAVDSWPASLSRRWVTDILRGELGFTGAVFCDDLSMGAAAAAIGDYRERAEQALAAGCDYLPVCNDRAAAVALVERLPHTADAGTRRRERLRAACRPPRVALDGKLAESYRARAARALITQIARAD